MRRIVKIVYISTTHLGKNGYYQSIKQKVDSLRHKNFKILYEAVYRTPNTSDTILRKFRKVTGAFITTLDDTTNHSSLLILIKEVNMNIKH